LLTTDAFHAHLNTCAQCREHPFALCALGAALLKRAAEDVMEPCEKATANTGAANRPVPLMKES